MDADSICKKVQEVLNQWQGRHVTADEAMEKIDKIMDEYDEYASWGDDR